MLACTLEHRQVARLGRFFDRPGIGQVAIAFVRLSRPVSEDDLRTHCAAGIAAFKVPARFVVVETFPTTDGPNGVKIRKSELRDRAARELDDAEQ